MIGMGDHPRVCGEHKVDDSTGEGAWGSSPRMRGTLRRAFRKFRRLGIIPAYAGNTQPVSPCRQCNRDHPRVCGEHDPLVPSVCDVLGSSPRMRGTLGRRVVGLCLVGIIPAYAGNTTNCGGVEIVVGIIPAYAGNTCPSTRAKCSTRGIIPAYAGNTRPALARRSIARDHPRVCGEHPPWPKPRTIPPGSSPRMRGTLQPHAGKVGKRGIIPAYAGNTSTDTTYSSPDRDHPRVCGEHPSCCPHRSHRTGSSPRMRGTQLRLLRSFSTSGIIPAYAGNTRIQQRADS